MIVLVHLQIPYSKYKICKSTLVGNQLDIYSDGLLHPK